MALRPPARTAATGNGLRLDFTRVPEAKTLRNRVHPDLRARGMDQESEVARVEALGAHRVDVGQTSADSWVVLADPEGNEFCVLAGSENSPAPSAVDIAEGAGRREGSLGGAARVAHAGRGAGVAALAHANHAIEHRIAVHGAYLHARLCLAPPGN